MAELIGFILGKNPDLSIAEILSYLSAKRIIFSVKCKENEFIIVEVSDKKPISINDLGGSIKIFSVVYADKDIGMLKIDADKLVNSSKDSLTFGISLYNIKNWNILQDRFSAHLKNQLRGMGVKAGYMHLPEDRSFLTHVEVLKKNLVENGEVIVCFSDRKYFIGKTIQVHNPFEFQKRDVGRPEQRAIYSIPPRLAKILINLLGIRNGTLLDPFCGIGTVLQEAMLMGFDIRGVDINGQCVKSAKKNLEWIGKEYKIEISSLDKKVIQGDSRKLSNFFQKNSIDGIATEPYLGPPLKGEPDRKRADKILSDVEDLYTKTLKEACIILKNNSKMCIVSPRIKMGNFSLGLNMKDIAEKTGFNLLKAYNDSEERHKIIREINVLERI